MEDSEENNNLTIASLVENKRKLETENIKLRAQLELMKELFDNYCGRYR